MDEEDGLGGIFLMEGIKIMSTKEKPLKMDRRRDGRVHTVASHEHTVGSRCKVGYIPGGGQQRNPEQSVIVSSGSGSVIVC